MKFKNLPQCYLLMLIVLFISCAKSDDDPFVEETTFSHLSVEEGKEKVEDSGRAMLDEIKLMENTLAMDVYAAFISFLDTSDPLDDGDYYNKSAGTEAVFGIETARSLTDASSDGMEPVLKSMLAISDDPESLQEVYDRMIGIYTWNDSFQKWDYTETGDNVVFRFPSTEDGTENDASYSISYQGVVINGNRFDEEYTGDFPKSVSAELKLDGDVISHSNATFSYDSEGMVTSFEFSYDVDAYLMAVSFSNDRNEEAGVDFLFRDDERVFMDLRLAGYGNWSDDNVNDNTAYYVEYWDNDEKEWVEVEVDAEDDYDYSELNVYNVVTRSNVMLQVMDVKVTGDIDFQNLWPEIEEIEKNWDWENNEEEAVDKEVELLNEHVNLALRDAANNEILALCEAYLIKDEDSYYHGGSEVTIYDCYMGLRFVFGDGSKIDAETYFDEDFDDLIDELESYLEELEDEYDD